MKIPQQIIAGDSLTWLESPFADPLGNSIDCTAYTLTFSFRGPSNGGLDVVATAAAPGWSLALTPAQTAAFNIGPAAALVSWQASAAKTGVRINAGTGTLRVLPNLAAMQTKAAFDGRSQAETTLAAIEAELAARATGGATVEYTIGSRSLKKEPMAALVELASRYRRIVAREKTAAAIANGLGNPGRLAVRFKA